MNRVSMISKGYAIVLSVLLIFSGLIFFPSSPISQKAEAASEWEQTTDSDFDNGTLTNLMINGSSLEANLQLSNATVEWTEKKPLTKPNPRYAHLMASIWGTDKVLLFGGYNWTSIYNYFNDTWVYDLSENHWKKIKTNNQPKEGGGWAMASVWGTDKVVLFGGQKMSTWYDETWIFDLRNGTWTKKTPSTKPNPSSGHAMSSIWGTDKVLLFAGQGGTMYEETWIYDLGDNNWTQKKPVSQPIWRYGHAMSQIWGTDKVALFAGQGQALSFKDTWVYDLSDNNWTDNDPSVKPSERYSHSLASFHGTDKVITFAGVLGNMMGDTWIYDLSDNIWRKKTPATSPSFRVLYGAAPIWGTKKALLFGGWDNTATFVDDTWTYTLRLAGHYENGTFVSAPYDTLVNSSFGTISWNANTSVNTSVKFQFRTAATRVGLSLKPFVGPDGNSSTYFISTPSAIWNGHYRDRWMQYIAYLNTTDVFETPILKNVSITYNNIPFTSLYGPDNGSAIPTNKPVFIWNFTDLDSSQQGTFQVLIDNNSALTSIDFDSGEQSTSNQSWQFPNGTGHTDLPDGTWYWKVRTKDNDGDWGLYSEPWKVIIDAKLPVSTIDLPENNECYNKLLTIKGTSSDNINGTGLKKVEISIKRLSDDKSWDGSNWIQDESWFSTSGKTNWEYITASGMWSSGSQYLVRSRAFDIAGNIEVSGSGNVFTIDTDDPTSEIEIPMENAFLNKLEDISGRASDIGGSDIDFVEIYLKQSSSDNHWNGSAWVSDVQWLTASGTAEWTVNTSTISWDSGTEYIVNSRATDHATNIETPANGHTFNIDLGRPTSNIEIPKNNTSYNKLDLIYGSAIDIGGAEIDRVEIYIKQVNNDLYWDGTDWVSVETWLVTEGTTSWSYDTTNVIWTSGSKYMICSRAVDFATNLEDPGSSKVFLFDNDNPSSSVEVPGINTFVNELNTISGEAIDTGASGVDAVKISIMRNGEDHWWSGNNWVSAEIWHTVKGISPWTFNTSRVKWDTDTNYTITSRANDHAGNIEIPSAGITFMFDNRPPEKLSINVNNGAEFTNSTAVILSLQAEDSGSGVSEMSFSPDGITWSTWEEYLKTKSFTLPEIDERKAVYFKVKDRAGNIAQPVFDTIILDTVPPVNVRILINADDEYTNSIEVVLSLKAEDSGSGIYQMAFSTDSITWSAWEGYEASRIFVLPEKDGTKHVYFKVKDRADNIAKYVFDHIILDTAPPEKVSILINEDAVYTNTTHVNLNLNAVDSLSGIYIMSFSNDGSKWTPWEPYQITKYTSLSTGDGEKTVYFKVIDNAGNIAFAFDTIILDTEPPHSLSILINNDEEKTNSPSVTLKLSATDDTSGVYQMAFSTDGSSWSKWENYANTKSSILQSNDGEKTIHFKVKDRAGNIAEQVEDSIIMVPAEPILNPDEEEPSNKQYFQTNLPFILFLIIILISIALFIVANYHRKKKRKLQEKLSEQKKTDLPGISLPGTPLVQAAPVQPVLTQNLAPIQPVPVATPTRIPAPTPAVTVPILAVPQTPQLPPAAEQPQAPVQPQPQQEQPIPSPAAAVQPQAAPVPVTGQQPEQQQVQQYPCAACGQPMSYIEQNQQYYCYNCQKYA